MAKKKQTGSKTPVEVLSLTKELQNFAHEHHLNELQMIEQIESSLAKSYKKQLKTDNDLIVTIDRSNNTFYIYEKVPVGEPDSETGEYLEFEEVDVTPADKSRFAANNLKPVLKQIVDDARKKSIYDEFHPRIGEIIYGTVVQDTKNFAIIKIRNGIEAELPHYDKHFFPDELDERPSGERYYKSNEPLAVMILDVRNPFEPSQQTARSRPMIVVTRKRIKFVEALLREYIPEIDEGTVIVKRIARDAGHRTKIAVTEAALSDVDPVGACVGPRGSRIKDISAEMQNERVEIVRWSSDPGEYVKSALGLRREGHSIINYETGMATVIVPDVKLSATIGKNGENARLAANLTGWKIDIKSESYVRQYGGFDGLFAEREDKAEAEPEFDGRCTFSDNQGRRCRNAARPGSHYCSLHMSEE